MTANNAVNAVNAADAADAAPDFDTARSPPHSGTYSGCFYVSDSTLTVSDSDFLSNTVNSGAAGGEARLVAQCTTKTGTE